MIEYPNRINGREYYGVSLVEFLDTVKKQIDNVRITES